MKGAISFYWYFPHEDTFPSTFCPQKLHKGFCRVFGLEQDLPNADRGILLHPNDLDKGTHDVTSDPTGFTE